jgi:hypothetical protein
MSCDCITKKVGERHVCIWFTLRQQHTDETSNDGSTLSTIGAYRTPCSINPSRRSVDDIDEKSNGDSDHGEHNVVATAPLTTIHGTFGCVSIRHDKITHAAQKTQHNTT